MTAYHHVSVLRRRRQGSAIGVVYAPEIPSAHLHRTCDEPRADFEPLTEHLCYSVSTDEFRGNNRSPIVTSSHGMTYGLCRQPHALSVKESLLSGTTTSLSPVCPASCVCINMQWSHHRRPIFVVADTLRGPGPTRTTMVNFTILAGGYTSFVVSYLFNSDSNSLTVLNQSPTGANPSWIALHPTNKSIL